MISFFGGVLLRNNVERSIIRYPVEFGVWNRLAPSYDPGDAALFDEFRLPRSIGYFRLEPAQAHQQVGGPAVYVVKDWTPVGVMSEAVSLPVTAAMIMRLYTPVHITQTGLLEEVDKQRQRCERLCSYFENFLDPDLRKIAEFRDFWFGDYALLADTAIRKLQWQLATRQGRRSLRAPMPEDSLADLRGMKNTGAAEYLQTRAGFGWSKYNREHWDRFEKLSRLLRKTARDRFNLTMHV